MSYKVDTQALDFGPQVHNRIEEMEFHVINTGRVPFSFRISEDRVSRQGVLEVTPSRGRVAKDKTK